MKTLEALIKALQDDETVKTYQALEEAIDNRPDLKKAYDDLLEKQKAMVRSETLKKDDAADTKRAYEKALQNLGTSPIIHQYLTLQEDINDDMRILFEIIETGVNEER